MPGEDPDWRKGNSLGDWSKHTEPVLPARDPELTEIV